MTSGVDTISEAVGGLADIDLDTLTDGELDDELVGLIRLRHRLEAEIARRADRWDRRTIWRGDGSKAPWARLSRTAAVAPGAARGILRRGHAIAAMPHTEAWAAGEVGADHVELLADAASNGRGDLFQRDEAVLVDHCRELTWGQLVKAMRYWTFRADIELNRDGTPPPASSLRMSTTFDGTVTGDFTLDPIGGATVAEALRRIERDLYRADQRDGVTRTTQERLAAALVEMAVRSQTVPKDGRRPEPLVCILAGEATIEHLCELSTGMVIAPDLVVPHLGRSQVQTFIFDGADRVIASSPTRTFRGMLRRAIQVRDRHCQHPSGCDEPITHCDVNHRTAYAEGGVTDEAGGDLECESHNRHSDLHDRRPAYLIDEARWRREIEQRTRQRIDDLVAERLRREARPPPAVGVMGDTPVVVQLRDVDGDAGEFCSAILELLPSWFGIPAANEDYAETADTHPSVIAPVDGDDVGITTVKVHSSSPTGSGRWRSSQRSGIPPIRPCR